MNSNEIEIGTHTIQWGGNTLNNDLLGSGIYYAIIDFDKSQTKLIRVAIINE